jgi:6-phosphogluconate dehydrogenase
MKCEKEVADIAVVGLAVMGQNLILNMNDHGFKVCVFNRTVSKVDTFLENEAKGTNIIGAHSVEEMVMSLKKPRRCMLMVQAGKAVDAFIDQLVEFLEPGDIIIDGGNSEYKHTQRRCKDLKTVKNGPILFVGSGVSGGEEGARYGPSIMPGGDAEAWPHVKDIFQSIAAKVDGEPCCDWVGNDGSGHFVKMVHNGIEYGDMQLICEAFDILKNTLGMQQDEIAEVFKEWNKTELDSFLIEITADILAYKENGEYLLPKIKDAAGQKGTGKWTAIESLDYGIPLTLIGESVFARCLSSLFDERAKASEILKGPKSTKYTGDKTKFIEAVRQALYASKIISYAQGFMLLKEAAKQFNWDLNYGGCAMMWRGGCIIRSKFLGNIKQAYDKNKDLTNLLLDDFFTGEIHKCQDSWREVVSTCTLLGVPMPCFSTALSFYDGYRSKTVPANLIQAQRDYFGAHTYQLLANPGTNVHTNWTGRGGNVSSTAYQV